MRSDDLEIMSRLIFDAVLSHGGILEDFQVPIRRPGFAERFRPISLESFIVEPSAITKTVEALLWRFSHELIDIKASKIIPAWSEVFDPSKRFHFHGIPFRLAVSSHHHAFRLSLEAVGVP